ncbi:MAG: glycoside hydrolase family 18 protein [Bacteroides cellulosilyticus]
MKVLLSAGGGGNKAIMAGVLLNDTYRNRFKKELLKAVEDWGFDGLDIDYEHWAGGPEGYGEGDKEKVALLENFYKELRTELPKGKLLTAAVSADYPEWNGAGETIMYILTRCLNIWTWSISWCTTSPVVGNHRK